MLFGSVCSGIEAASVAWHPLGWRAAWLAEIDPFACAVLAHHYPEVPNIGDMTTLLALIASGEAEAPDLLCGGTPCQAFSVAGLRRSLDDARGNLSLVFCEIANAIDTARAARGEQPAIVFWENVPGVLNTKDNAFGCFLAGLAGEDDALVPPGGKWADAGAVFGPARAVAWRVLDAQFFGLAQRRRRVFVVASARDDFDPAAVLLEFDGVRRDSAPSREAGEGTARGAAPRAVGGGWPAEVAGTLDASFGKKWGLEDQHINRGASLFVPHGGLGVATYECGGIGAYSSSGVSSPLLRTAAGAGHGCAALVAFHHNAQAAQLPSADRDTSISDSLTCSQQAAVAFHENQRAELTLNDTAGTVKCAGGKPGQGYPAVLTALQVRRLTPRECERLQGFPDDYTLIPYRNKPAADGPRYKALGNSWAVPVVRWIGQRIAAHLLEGLA